jgi:hypothetical protein
MKQHIGKLLAGLALLTLAMLPFTPLAKNWVAPDVAHAQVVLGRWTAIGASGTVDESALTIFGFTGPSAGYNSTSTSTNAIELRYNVTNTYDNASVGANIPGWTTLEVGGVGPATSYVQATLYRVVRCTGAQTIICQTPRITGSDQAGCKTCTFVNTAVNFTNDLYSVRVIVDRATPSEQPRVHTLRIF